MNESVAMVIRNYKKELGALIPISAALECYSENVVQKLK